MRPILSSAIALTALSAALPAHAQGAVGCARDRATIAELESRNTGYRLEGSGDENEYRDRYAALNREIADLNTSGKNFTRLIKLRNERDELLLVLNQARLANHRVQRNEAMIAGLKAQMQKNGCGASTAGGSSTSGYKPSPPIAAGGRKPWEREPAPAPRPRAEPSLQVGYSADVKKGPKPPPSVVMTAQPANNWEVLPDQPVEPDIPAKPTRYTPWMTGNFTTSFGNMKLSPGGGNYENYGGKLTVDNIEGATMEGRWTQTDSGGQCQDKTNRGRFRFTFTETGFTGSWSYCDKDPDKGGWNGTRIK